MMVWKHILEPKNPELSLEHAAQVASYLGYPMVSHGGKIYRITAPGKIGTLSEPGEPAKLEETGSTPDMFDLPSIFCVMDADKKKIAMNDFGPVLFANPVSAQLFAEHIKGVVKSLNEAIYLQREAMKNASPLVLPEKPGLIVPATR